MNRVGFVVCCLLLCGCSTVRPPATEATSLLHDDWFAAPSETVSSADVFTLSAAMHRFIREELVRQMRSEGSSQRGLIMALHRREQLKLEYDATRTRNAAEAFDARKGNCLSLVLMTAAFAKELGMQVTYQSVVEDDIWSRHGDIAYLSGHVNIVLDKGHTAPVRSFDPERLLTVDFLPAADILGQHTQAIPESTVLAMYMNNRAAEALAAGRLDDAYWWARGAVLHAAGFAAARNTLGIVYLRSGRAEAAVVAFNDIVKSEPDHPQALSNLELALLQMGRTGEAAAVRAHLAQVERYAPFLFLRQGLIALDQGDLRAARALFAQEVERADYNSEVHFWLGVATARLGDVAEARRQFAIALRNSTTVGEHALYEGKLARLQAAETQ